MSLTYYRSIYESEPRLARGASQGMLTEGFHTHGGSQGNSFNKNIIMNTSYFP